MCRQKVSEFIFIIFITFFLSEFSSAAMLEVGEGKTYQTIQAAINAATNGDTIKVYEGEYVENVKVGVVVNEILTGPKKLIIQSEDPNDWATVEATIIDGGSNGSVVRSWLIELAAKAFKEEDNDLEKIAPFVDDSGTARWTTDYAVENAVPVPTITMSLYKRFASRLDEPFSDKVIAALRNQFGGHAMKEELAHGK